MADTDLSSRDRMIEAAIELMRAFGYSGVGINDVVRESGAPRGSLYHFFPEGKAQIASEALTVQGERIIRFMQDAMARKRSSAQKILALFEAYAVRVEEGQFTKSCAIGAVTLDLEPDAAALRAVVARILEDWRALIAQHLPMGSAKETASFASFVLSTIEGAHIQSRAQRSGQPFREAGVWLSRLARE